VAAAALDERRRVARELHDGLAQELAYLAVESKRVGAARLEDAARRALDEARAAVNALTLGGDEPFPAALASAAEDVTERSGARLEVDLPAEPVDLPLEARQALVRVVREAVANATRHGHAETVRLTVEQVGRPAQLRVRVADDGAGFDVSGALAARRGFGLQSIRERVEGLGGSVRITSAAGAGTQVEVVVP
jgi:signal transduction histidine kinase